MTTQGGKDTGRTNDLELAITREFSAPAGEVYRAWTDGGILAKWSAPRDFTISHAGGDIRVGGAWRVTMIAPDGTEHRAAGTYRELTAGVRIVMTHGWTGEDGRPEHETTVSIRFIPADGERTRMEFAQGIFASKESRDGHAGGWSQCFDKLEEIFKEALGGR